MSKSQKTLSTLPTKYGSKAPSQPTSTTTSKQPTSSAAVKATPNVKKTTKKSDEPDSSRKNATVETSGGRNIKPKVSSSNDKQPLNKMSKTKTSITATAKDSIPGKAPIKATKSTQPLRARNISPAQTKEINKGKIQAKSQPTAPSKPNAVLDTPHNVTVASPPVRRKLEREREPQAMQKTVEKRSRTRTRTLEPEEVVVLRRDSAKKQYETAQTTVRKTNIKDPVAFDVAFDEKQKKKHSSEASTSKKTGKDAASDEGSNEYSDDFESYESDFESGSSERSEESAEVISPIHASESDESDHDKVSTDGDDSDDSDDDEEKNESPVESEEETDLTQYQVTVIHRDKEHKLDSGNYEMNSRKPPVATTTDASMAIKQLQQFDSFETLSGVNSDQLDSGISTYGSASQSELNMSKSNALVFYGGYRDFFSRPVVNKRGRELMSKIQFDTLSYTLFDIKPISYDIYMQTYGRLNANQTSTQTQQNRLTVESQTELPDVRTMWTQHPPLYDTQTVQRLGIGLNSGSMVQNSCGEMQCDAVPNAGPPKDEFEASLHKLNAIRQQDNCRTVNRQLQQFRKPVDFDRLSAFLLSSTMLMSKVLNSKSSGKGKPLENRCMRGPEFSAISDGCLQLDTQLLNALRVVRIFANPHHNLVITVHESLPDADVYRLDFSNLLMVWLANECSKPLRLLSTWSEVTRAEICNDNPNVVVCGLRDGSMAMWDLRETYSFCSKLDGYLTHFAATQTVVPTMRDKTANFRDSGAVVDVKSFRSPAKSLQLSNTTSNYKSIQFASLSDTGILAIWTLIDSSQKRQERHTTPTSRQRSKSKHSSVNINSEFEYSSPWARVKLIQSAICDLREYLESGPSKDRSHFERTKSLFQQNIYSDKVLREITATAQQKDINQDPVLKGVRFTNIDTGCEVIYVATNRNFLISCTKSLKTERFHRISINESRLLFPTALCTLSNDDFVAVGLSNGSVIILNCGRHRTLPSADADTHTHEPRASTSTARNVAKDAPSDPLDIDRELGKSCAIQNIILNERKPPKVNNSDVEYDRRPTTAACIEMITNQKRPFELLVYNQQLLLSGSGLRQHLVQSLTLSSNGWRLFAVSNGQLRVYDFYLDREILSESGSQVNGVKTIDAKTAQNGPSSEQYLITLSSQNAVLVHFLKQ